MDRFERVIILGGGYSVFEQGVDVNALSRKGVTIGVNDSALLADVDVAVSMDRLWMENRFERLREKKLPTWLRSSAYRKNLKDEKGWPGLYLFDNDHEATKLSSDPDVLDGFNSGVCAVNLAYHWKPQELYLFGFDMKKSDAPQPYWYPAYDWPQAKPEGNTGNVMYLEWSRRFDSIAEQLKKSGTKVFNVSPNSALDNFPKITYQQFLEIPPCAP